MTRKRLRLRLMHAVIGVPEPEVGLRQAACSAWALATETSRSLLVPPNRMVIPHYSIFRHSGARRRRDPNLEIAKTHFEIPGSHPSRLLPIGHEIAELG